MKIDNTPIPKAKNVMLTSKPAKQHRKKAPHGSLVLDRVWRKKKYRDIYVYYNV